MNPAEEVTRMAMAIFVFLDGKLSDEDMDKVTDLVADYGAAECNQGYLLGTLAAKAKAEQ